ncbi:MAG: 50S ribosomal protein L6 [Calditrichia bacterium]
MSRIGKLPIDIPAGVDIKIEGDEVFVKGPKGELSYKYNPGLTLEIEEGKMHVKRPSDERQWRALHGLTRTLINNLVVGVSAGFTKTLIIEGVGYKAEKKGDFLVLNVGYSHPIYFYPPPGITIETPQPIRIVVSGIDKVLVGEVTAKIRSFRKPEPYKGKGIRYEGEYIRRKAGKTAA